MPDAKPMYGLGAPQAAADNQNIYSSAEMIHRQMNALSPGSTGHSAESIPQFHRIQRNPAG